MENRNEINMISQEDLRKCLSGGIWAGRPLLFKEKVDSTNAWIIRLARREEELSGTICGDMGSESAVGQNQAGHGTLAVAELQESGRGRRGRSWESPKGSGIWMSILLKPELPIEKNAMITLVMAMAVRKTLSRYSGSSLIKWPNDIVIDGKKVCGILTEMSATADRIEYVVIGTGINVLNEGFKDDLKELAVSVGMLSEKVPERARILEKINAAFEKRYEIFLRTHDLRSLKDEYNSFMAGRDEEIRASGKKGELRGKARGIDDRGRLIVETADEKRLLESGEISIRGIYGIH